MPTPRRQSGFATILILMLLFMMLMLAITYLRVMRAYSLTHAQLAPGADQILIQLKADIGTIIGADGKIGPVGRQNPQTDSDIQEPYDYPWTNTARSLSDCRLSYPQVRTSKLGMGDPKTDDTWLAPCEPESLGTGMGWAQVSNIAGSFLVYNDATLSGTPRNAATREFVPSDAPAGAAIANLAQGQFVNFQNLPTTDPRLVDTDSDGVGDALWFYPKNNLAGGLRYVAAARVVDLSGMVNLNTALGELASAPSSSAGCPRKGEGPYEIDPTKLGFSAMPAASKTFRFPAYAGAPSTPLAGSATDYGFWMQAGAKTGADGQSANGTTTTSAGERTGTRYTLDDEIQLRDFSDKSAKSLIPKPVLFDIASPAHPGQYGAMPSNDIRKRLTTISGAQDRFAPPPFSGSGSNASVGYNYYTGFTHRAGDLNLYQMDSAGLKNGQWWSNTIEDYYYFYGGSYPGMQELLEGVDSTTPNDDYPFPEGFKTLVPTAADRPREYQIQMGVCLQDALERDNMPTQAWSWMGWKPLPLLTEFYAEMPYVCAGWQTWSPDTSNPANPGGAAVLLQKNTSLSTLTPLIGYIWVSGAWNNQAEPYFWDTATAGQITFQLQEFDGGNTHVIKCKLTQVGSDIYIQNLYGKYKAGDQRGQDFDTLAGTTVYGSKPLFAGPVQAADGTWSAIYFNTQETRNPAVDSGRVNPAYNDPRWGLAAGMGSYAFELANPYSVPIRLANLRFTFRRYDYQDYSINQWAGYSMGNSQPLDSFITAAAGMAKDAEGYYVLKPGEKIVFYRNGTENTNRPKASTDDTANRGALRPNAFAWGRPFGGPTTDASGNVDLTKTLFPPGGAPPAGVYAINLGVANTAPDINGQPSTHEIGQFELQVKTKYNSGTPAPGAALWVAYNRATYQALGSGYDVNNCFICESNIPSSRQATPGAIVYKQIDVRTFGGDEKLNLLQSRPPLYWYNTKLMPKDWGDWEFRTNTYATSGSQVLGATAPGNGVNPYPAQGTLPNGWSPGHLNSATTMPMSATFGQYNTALPTFGAGAKLPFATQTKFPSGNSDGTTNGVTYANYTTFGGRQDIKNGELFFNYMGIPGDANYPGTFPELASSPEAAPATTSPETMAVPVPAGGRLGRDNATANATNGKERRDGTPRAMELEKILMVGPLYYSRESGGNSAYRGLTDGNWGSVPSTGEQMAGMAWQNTIGDAIQFYLAKDLQINGAGAKGLRGLCLRPDVPFYDQSKIGNALLAGKSLDQLYSDLAAKQAQLDALPGPPAPPAVDPNAATRAGYTADLATINAGIRGQMNWTLSWASVICQYFQVDSPKYKGKTANNGDDFKPGTLNLNTASKEALSCLSLPGITTSGFTANNFLDGIVQARKGPANGTASGRLGLAMTSELVDQGAANFGLSGTGANGDLLKAVSWLPQQATCRSDVFCAHILLQGYKQDDFNAGPVDVRRAIVFYKRDTSGNPAQQLSTYVIPNQ